MLGWLKDQIVSHSQMGKANGLLTDQFAPVAKLKGTNKNLPQRMAHFVLTGDDENILNELQTLKLAGTVMGIGTSFGTGKSRIAVSLPSLVAALPEEPAIYLRLAKIYFASRYPNGNTLGHHSSIPGFQGTIPWLGVFMAELSQSGTLRTPLVPAKLIQSMIEEDRKDPNLLVKGALFYEDAQGKCLISRWLSPPYAHFQCLNGMSELIQSSTELVRTAFSQKDASSRAHALHALRTLEVTADPFLEEIARLSVSGSKEVREAAEPLVAANFGKLRPLLEQLAAKGSSDERYHAVRFLIKFRTEDQNHFLEQRLAEEKSAKVKEALAEILHPLSHATSSSLTNDDELKLQPVAKVHVVANLDKRVLHELRAAIDDYEKKSLEEFANNPYAQSRGKKRTPTPAGTADRLFEALQTFVVKDGESWPSLQPQFYSRVAYQNLQRFAGRNDFELIHLMRWCLLLSGRPTNQMGWEKHRWTFGYAWRESILSFQKAHKKPVDLRELAEVFHTLNLDDKEIGEHLLQENSYFPSPLLRSNPDAIWPYFLERLELLEEALGLMPSGPKPPGTMFWEHSKRENAFGILELFPQLPSRFVSLMWELALGKAKTDRAMAQKCLQRFPNKEEKIIAALSSKQQDARLAAAQWLGELRCNEAMTALRTALDKEKSEPVKDELIKALELLGVKLEELLDLNELEREAEKGLKRGIPDDLKWFPFEQLPTVHWSDSGEEVPEKILQWFIVLGYKLKTAEANPTLRRYGSVIRKEDRERLGKFIVETWIAQDVKPKYTPEQASAEAQKQAQQSATYAKQFPKYYPDFDEHRFYQTAYNQLLVLPEGSQTSTKGILAVAGACCGGDVAPLVHRYVKQWYGYRGSQSKALLQVLAWIDHPSAIQVVLSIANRFRTKGIQEEAAHQCELLAQRKGWTIDELADRTIPTAGFDEDAEMELDYGSRTFVAKLAEDMSISIENQNGKKIASLPDPNQSDDAEKAKQSKALLSTARKELKTVLTMQRDRLYEALCTQRSWNYADWNSYLNKHPIVGRFCQRLVWVAYDGEKQVETFRPLADNTLTNSNDDEVNLSDELVIRLAHDTVLSEHERKAWLQHFDDYKVDALFQQLGKNTIELTEDLKKRSEIVDFVGHLVKSFSLRNRLTKLGYTRGAAQDGGWFTEYRKSFLSLGLEAVIEFSGSPMPEVNRTVALQRLYFTRKPHDGGPSIAEEVTLGDLPSVLLTESWNDIRMAAADGTGFAPDWEKQVDS